MASRSISRLRRFSRLSCWAVFAAIGLSCAFRSLGAEVEVVLAKRAPNAGETIFHLRRAATLWPYDYQMRTAPAYFWVSTRFYEAHEVAIPEMTEALVTNPFAGDMLKALADYKTRKDDVAPR